MKNALITSNEKKQNQEGVVDDDFVGEGDEVEYGYFSGYEKPKEVIEQIKLLHQYFPEIGEADEAIADLAIADQVFPEGAEGWFAIPKWETIAPTYALAVRRVLEKLKKVLGNGLYSYCEERIEQKYFRQSEGSIKAWTVLAEEQDGYDILIVPAQFGINYVDCPVRRVLQAMPPNEFGLGAFAVGIMLLTHPEERLSHCEDLWINCAGDEFSSKPDNRFDSAPYFSFFAGQVELGLEYTGASDGYHGSSSGFLPQLNTES